MRHDVAADAVVPSWCAARSDASQISEVRFSAHAEVQLATAASGGALRFYEDAAIARLAIEQTLQLDIRSVHQGRGQTVDAATGGQEYVCRFDALQIRFTTLATHVLVTRCEAAG